MSASITLIHLTLNNILRRIQSITDIGTRASNRIFFHFPVSEGYNKVDNRIANFVKIIG